MFFAKWTVSAEVWQHLIVHYIYIIFHNYSTVDFGFNYSTVDFGFKFSVLSIVFLLSSCGFKFSVLSIVFLLSSCVCPGSANHNALKFFSKLVPDFPQIQMWESSKQSILEIYIFIYLLFRAIPVANGNSQAKCPIGTAAVSLHHGQSNAISKPHFVIYTTAHGNAGSLTHWTSPGIKPKSSWILSFLLSLIGNSSFWIFLISSHFFFFWLGKIPLH